MLTASLISAAGMAARSNERNHPSQSGDDSFGRILAAEVGSPKPSPAPNKNGTGIELLRTEAGKVSDLIQSWVALVGNDGSDVIKPEAPPQASDPGASNSGAGNPGEAADYWTPERMQTALPLMPSPTVNPGGDVAILPFPNDEGEVGDFGAPPPSEQTV